MTYTQKFVETKYAPIQEALDQLPGLVPGGEVKLSGLSDVELARARWLLYDWLFHTAAKSSFRIRLDRERREITVRKIGIDSKPVVSVSRGGIPLALENLLSELVALDDLQQAEALLGEWAQEGKVNATQLGQLLLELRRVMS
jgi:hypothetical protein